MTVLQLAFVLVASIWAGLNTLIAGYTAVNTTRDQVITGHTVEGVPLSLPHRRIMYRNDWIPLKIGLAAASLVFGGFIVFLPELADEPERLRTVCYVASLLPMGSFLGFFVLGLSDRRVMRAALSEAEARVASRLAPDAEAGPRGVSGGTV